MSNNQTSCEFCKEGHSKDAGGYYDAKQCERDFQWNAYLQASDNQARERARKAYEIACYTGD